MLTMEAFVAKVLGSVLEQGLSLTFSVVAVICLYKKIKDCEADRARLWERLLALAQERE
jgi:hypothetical protein